MKAPPTASTFAVTEEGSRTLAVLPARLDAGTCAQLWRPALALGNKPRTDGGVVLDATGVEYMDGSGLALITELRNRLQQRGTALEVRGLRAELQGLLDLHEPDPEAQKVLKQPHHPGTLEETGAATRGILEDLVATLAFIGELTRGLGWAATHPHRVRWRDMVSVAEAAGANALPVVLLVGFLIGFVMAFQAAIPMRQFGADIYVASLVAISMVRELGPLITAFTLAGRSASAFAAEIGTMKVNEEVSALVTLGLDPMRFLVVPRALAAVVMTPLLTIYANVAGLLGGLVVFVGLGYAPSMFFTQVTDMVGFGDFAGGMVKAFVFGIIVAGVGCMRGLQTGSGSSAVGISTTSAVVTCIVLITFSDGVFAFLYYILGI